MGLNLQLKSQKIQKKYTVWKTTLTGFAKTYIANTINVSARAKQTSKQEQADTGAGKPRVMLAKSGIASDMNNTVEKAGGKVIELNEMKNTLKEEKREDDK